MCVAPVRFLLCPARECELCMVRRCLARVSALALADLFGINRPSLLQSPPERRAVTAAEPPPPDAVAVAAAVAAFSLHVSFQVSGCDFAKAAAATHAAHCPRPRRVSRTGRVAACGGCGREEYAPVKQLSFARSFASLFGVWQQ